MTCDLSFLESNINYFKTILDTVQAGINIIDRDGTILYVNYAYCEMNGYERHELIGKSLALILPDKNPEKGLENYKKIINNVSNIPYVKESYNIRKDGSKFPVLISWNYLTNNGLLEGMVTVVQDLTSIKIAEEELSATKAIVNTLKKNIENRDTLEYLMGDSDEISEVFQMIKKVAQTDFSVLLIGDTGVGKEIVAESIHNFSPRKNKNMIKIDCGAIPETLMESELFGYRKGAFTGADKTKEGAFQKANHGTIFLDEITNLSAEMQKKLLRILQDRNVRKIGSQENEQLDIRIIAATNDNIEELVKKNQFRDDLYYRLNEFSIQIPPLRKRKDDIPFLALRFIKETCKQLKIPEKRISDQALKYLIDYDWPGNVRELKNVIKKAIVISDRKIKINHLKINSNSVSENQYIETQLIDPTKFKEFDLKKYVKQHSSQIEKDVITKTLKYFEGNKSKTARFLHIDYKTLLTKIKEY